MSPEDRKSCAGLFLVKDRGSRLTLVPLSGTNSYACQTNTLSTLTLVPLSGTKSYSCQTNTLSTLTFVPLSGTNSSACQTNTHITYHISKIKLTRKLHKIKHLNLFCDLLKQLRMTFQDILIQTTVTCLSRSNCPMVSAFLTLLLQMWTSVHAGLPTGVHRSVST